MNKIMLKMYKGLYKVKAFRKHLIHKIAYHEGGEWISQTIREYAREHNVIVGKYTYGFCFSEKFNLGGYVNIGKYCSIAENVRYFGANHPTNHVSTSAYFYNKSLGLDVEDVERNTLNIGNDVWIGYGAIITSGCNNIGNGAVIGAGTIVTKDIEPYTIVVGNPAKVIKKRFDDDVILKLESLNWWDKKPEELYCYYKYMNNPDQFITLFRQKSFTT